MIEENPTYKMTAKYGGFCAKCGKKIPKGAVIVYDSDGRRIFHPECLVIAAPAPVTTKLRMVLCRGGKAWSIAIPYEQREQREQIKDAGFYWHGPGKCGSGRCFACNSGVPPKDWYTTDYTIADKVRSLGTPEALAAIDKLLRVEDMSRSADAEFSVPIPVGLSYYPYQIAGIQWLYEFPRTMIGDDPGLGKTIQVLGLMNLDPKIQKTLIICPASLCRNWQREAERFLVRPTAMSVLTTSEDMLPLIDRSANEPILGITNFEKLIKGRGKGLLESIQSVAWDLVVVDEGHRIKNPKAAQTKAILGVSTKTEKGSGLITDAPRAVILTGTPIPNKVKELHPLIAALRPDKWKSFYSFAMRYCNAKKVDVGKYTVKMVWDFDGESHLEELQIKLRSSGTMLRRLKSDVLKELPPKRRRLLVLDPDSAEAKKIVKTQQSDVEALDAAMVGAALAHRDGDDAEWRKQMQVLSSGRIGKLDFTEMSQQRQIMGRAKAIPASDYVKDLLEDGVKKVVVFMHHQEVQDIVEERLKSFHPVRIAGRDSAKAKDAAVQAFQNNPEVRVCICSTLAAGVGITLTAASHVVFVEFDFVPANVVQAEDRCHRIGQSEPVVIDYLAFPQTIDQRMAELIIQKLDTAEQALDAQRDRTSASIDPALGQPVYTLPPESQLKVKTCPQHIKDLLLDCIQQLAGVCDGARQKDGVGFSGCWVGAGHRLSIQSALSDYDARLAQRIVLYHQKQLGLDPKTVIW